MWPKPPAIVKLNPIVAWKLKFGVFADIVGCSLERRVELRRDTGFGVAHFRGGDGYTVAFQPIELSRVFEHRLVAALAHCFQNRRDRLARLPPAARPCAL